LDDPFVAEQLDREFTMLVHDQAQIVMCLKRAGRYFPYISRELKAAGLPDDLKYLAVTESFLLHYVQSKAGALGLWQFMPATGRQFQLVINNIMDERLNPEKSTLAAIAYCKFLYGIFKNWPLALAAYNCGQGTVLAQMKEQGAGSYYELYLPRETMRYVYRIMAIKIILSDPAAYGYHLPPERIYQPYAGDTVKFTLNNELTLRELAAASQSSVRFIRELNPELLSNTLPKGSYQLLVPAGQGDNVLKRLNSGRAAEELAPEPAGSGNKPAAAPDKPAVKPRPAAGNGTVYQVRAGDTLSSIARQHKVSLEKLRQANQLKGDNIRPGQKLNIP
jgi:LysM repeat protein